MPTIKRIHVFEREVERSKLPYIYEVLCVGFRLWRMAQKRHSPWRCVFSVGSFQLFDEWMGWRETCFSDTAPSTWLCAMTLQHYLRAHSLEPNLLPDFMLEKLGYKYEFIWMKALAFENVSNHDWTASREKEESREGRQPNFSPDIQLLFSTFWVIFFQVCVMSLRKINRYFCWNAFKIPKWAHMNCAKLKVQVQKSWNDCNTMYRMLMVSLLFVEMQSNT